MKSTRRPVEHLIDRVAYISEIMSTYYFGSDIAQLSVISLTLSLLIFAISAVLFHWWTRSPIAKLLSHAQRLKLKLHNTEELSLFEAVADQLSLLNPNGTYTADIIKHHITRNETTSFMKTIRRQLNIWVKMKLWKDYLDDLNIIADANKRIIEIVHCDRKETTVIRPSGTGVTRQMQTMYIGYGGYGRFYTLRPDSDTRSAQTTPTANSVDDSNSNVTSNVLIGDGARQYVLDLPRDQDEEYIVTKNIVVGDNTSQTIHATFRTTQDIIELLHEMESSGPEGSEHRLKLKIREYSKTLSEEQLKEKHQRIIDLLEDKGSEARVELEESLKPFSVSYEKATLGCILLHLRIDTLENLRTFVTRFRTGDLEKIIMIFASEPYHNTSTYDIQLQSSISPSATESEKMSNLNRYISNSNEKTLSKPKSLSSGSFSLVLRKQADPRQSPSVSHKELAQEVAGAAVDSLSKAKLFEDASGIDCHFEKYCALNTEQYTNKPSRDVVLNKAANTRSESMRGCVGVIRVDNVQTGTCFRIGPTYLMTAYHVIKARLDDYEYGDNCLNQENIHVEFPDVNEKHLAKMVFYDDDFDVAVLKITTENAERKTLSYVIECHPGRSFHIVSYLNSLRKTRRAIVASTDYTAIFTSSELILFESDEFEHGCSGSPCITTNIHGEPCLVTMLLGSIITDTDAFYYGVKMTEVEKLISNENPKLANELFGTLDKVYANKKQSDHEDTMTRKKLDQGNSTQLRQRSTRINGS